MAKERKEHFSFLEKRNVYLTGLNLATNCPTVNGLKRKAKLQARDWAIRLPGSSDAETTLPGSLNVAILLDFGIV